MAEDRDFRFWQRVAGIYDLFLRKERKTYDRLGAMIVAELSMDMDVLELAAGTGLIAERIAGSCGHYTATDYSPQMLKKAQRKNWPSNVSFEQADATALSYPGGSFDAVIIANALHIMPTRFWYCEISGGFCGKTAS